MKRVGRELEMKYDEWLKSVPAELAEDSLWRMEAYRLALFMGDICWHDVSKLVHDKRTLDLANQLYRSAGSIAGNIAEGYSRGTGRDRSRFYEYALGSARESRGWYYHGRQILGENVMNHRLNLLGQIIRLLLTMIAEQRGPLLKESQAAYVISGSELTQPLGEAPLP